jgi:outer membrane protein assembly factor BamB
VFMTTAISTPVGASVDTSSFSVSPANVDTSLAEDPARMLSLHALDAATGAVLWRSPLTRQTYAHPTYVNDVLLVPSTVGLSVSAFDAAAGLPLWTSPLAGPPSSGVAVTERGAYLGVGTRQTDAGFKLFGTDSAVPPQVQDSVPSAVSDLVGSDPQERVAGIWAFQLAGG